MPGLTTRMTTQISIYKPSFTVIHKQNILLLFFLNIHVIFEQQKSKAYIISSCTGCLLIGCLIKLIIGSEYHWAVLHLQQVGRTSQLNLFCKVGATRHRSLWLELSDTSYHGLPLSFFFSPRWSGVISRCTWKTARCCCCSINLQPPKKQQEELPPKKWYFPMFFRYLYIQLFVFVTHLLDESFQRSTPWIIPPSPSIPYTNLSRSSQLFTSADGRTEGDQIRSHLSHEKKIFKTNFSMRHPEWFRFPGSLLIVYEIKAHIPYHNLHNCSP